MAAKTQTKDEQEPSTQLATVPTDSLSSLFGSDRLAAIQQEYGVTVADVSAPIPETPTATNFIQLCTQETQIFDVNGNLYDDVLGHTGPLMFLEKRGESDGDKFDAYDGFYIYAVEVPGKGKMIVTIGRLKGELKGSVPLFLDTLSPGSVFQIARFKTSHGYGVLNPVPVQINGKLVA